MLNLFKKKESGEKNVKKLYNLKKCKHILKETPYNDTKIIGIYENKKSLIAKTFLIDCDFNIIDEIEENCIDSIMFCDTCFIFYSIKLNCTKIYNKDFKMFTIYDGFDVLTYLYDNHTVLELSNTIKHSRIIVNVDDCCTVLEYKYNDLDFYNIIYIDNGNDYINVIIDGVNRIFNLKTNKLLKIENCVISDGINNILTFFYENDITKFGLLKTVDDELEIILQPNYHKIIYDDGIFKLYKNDVEYFIATKDFKIFTPPTKILQKCDDNNFIIQNEKFGLLDENLNIILPCKYDYIKFLINGIYELNIDTNTDFYKSGVYVENVSRLDGNIPELYIQNIDTIIPYRYYVNINDDTIKVSNSTILKENICYIHKGIYYENIKDLLMCFCRCDNYYLYLTLILNKDMKSPLDSFQYEINKKYTYRSISTHISNENIEKHYDSNIHNKYNIQVDINSVFNITEDFKINFTNFVIIN